MRLPRPMVCRRRGTRCSATRSGRSWASRFALSPGYVLLPFRSLERRLEVERAVVERAAGDGSADAFALVAGELLDVLQAVDTAAGDHRNLQLPGELDSGLDVDAGEHAVPADVGVDDRLDAVVLVLFRQIDDVVPGELRPAVRGDFPLSRVEA